MLPTWEWGLFSRIAKHESDGGDSEIIKSESALL